MILTSLACSICLHLVSSAPDLDLWQFSTTQLSTPTMAVQDPSNPNVQFVCCLNGKVRVFENGTEQTTSFLEIEPTSQILAMVFDSDPRVFYLYRGHVSEIGFVMQISKFSRASSSALVADAGSEQVIFRQPYSSQNVHLGGALRFGNDGLLYLGLGDGYGAGDFFVDNPAQLPFDLRGKFIRINPHADDFPSDSFKNYSIPADNPFLDHLPISAAPEIWSFGVRNPFRFSFDNFAHFGSGAMVLGETGNHTEEEIDIEPSGLGGRNYGWDRWEGDFDLNPNRQLAYEPHFQPNWIVPWINGYAMVGGGVYRGLQLGEEFFGRCFFADYLSGNITTLRLTYDQSGEGILDDEQPLTFNRALGSLVCIEPDSDGELLVVRLNPAQMFRIVRSNFTWLTSYSLPIGRLRGGEIRSLIAEDGNPLSVELVNEITSKKTRTAQILINAKTNRPSASGLEVEGTAKFNMGIAAVVSIEIYDWNTQTYSQIGSAALSKDFQEFTIGSALQPGFVSSSSQIQLRLTAKYDRPVVAKTTDAAPLSLIIEKLKLSLS